MRIQDNMFDFENLVDLDNRSIQMYAHHRKRWLCISGAEPVVEVLLNMSQRAGAMF